MKKFLFLSSLLIFTACSNISQTTSQIKSFAKCYIHKLPAPFWVCYQSSFMSVGKIKASKDDRLNEEVAYSEGINNLIFKLQSKTSLMLKKLNIKNKKLLNEIKQFVIMNAIQKSSWFDKKNHMLYVDVEVDKNEFRKFLEQKLKIDKKIFKDIFDESF